LPSERGANGSAVRAEAAKLNQRVLRDGRSLDAVMARAKPFADRDRGLLAALVYGSLRWHHRLQWQLERLLTAKLARRDAVLGSLLRIGLFELQFLRVPDHAAVSTCVDAARRLGLARAKGLVNAVLRRFLRERAELDAKMQSQPVALYSHPAWLIDACKTDWPDRWQALLTANNEPAPMWLRVNRQRTSRASYLAELKRLGIDAEVPPEPASAVLLDAAIPVSRLPGYASGLVSVQDAGAQLAAGWLDLEHGQRVLDACAAPGGKAAHMLESCPDLKELWAVDADPARLETVADYLSRLGLNAKLVCADARHAEEWWDGAPFDRILLDAPCTALGVIRRHPDIKLLREPADTNAAALRQAELLDSLWGLLAPGGRLVYATCTVLRRENHSQIRDFLARTRDAVLGELGERQLLPGEANMDGFYYACLDKQPI
jgi:16S rRNA (cytosine967-C5)-methyltransferase